MKRWLNILIIFCVLLTASSLKAEDRPTLPTDPIKAIKIFEKSQTRVRILGDDAKKIGLDANELTDYLRLKIKNNFANIKLEERENFFMMSIGDILKSYERNKRRKDRNNFETFEEKLRDENVGVINMRIWVVGDDFPIAYHLEFTFSTYGFPRDPMRDDDSFYFYWKFFSEITGVRHSGNKLWHTARLGYGSKDDVSDTIKKNIDEIISSLAISFFKRRGEL